MAKRSGALITAIICISLFLLGPVWAINLKVSANPIQKSYISDLNEPAIIGFNITNLEETDTFRIYSLVGVDIKAEETRINKDESKNVIAYVSPSKSVAPKSGPFVFEYKIKNSKNEIYTDYMTVNIAPLKDAVSVITSDIDPGSQTEKITVQNNADYDFKGMSVRAVSNFFSFEETFDLGKMEKKEFEVPLDIQKTRNSLAGSYLASISVNVNGVLAKSEPVIKFIEQEDIKTSNVQTGIFITKSEIKKSNVGNTEKQIEVNAEKNIISYLFTTFNIVPEEVNIQGARVFYSWQKNLAPNEELTVIITTNWFYPIIIIALAAFIFWLIIQYIESDLVITKQVSFVNTTGGEFALKVSLKAKAKKSIEKVHIVDRLPHLVELYKKFGAIEPDKVDLNNKRLEWNIESLNRNQEKIFSYLIYSKIGIVGKFELPCATATYQKNGRHKKAESNRSFFVNQSKK